MAANMGNHTPESQSKWPVRTVGLGLGLVALGGCFPADSNQTRPQVYYASEAMPFAGDRLLVMSANVFGWESLNGRPTDEQFLELLEGQKPDVVFGQEWKENSELFAQIRELGYSYAIAPTRSLPEFTDRLPQLGKVGMFILVKDAEMELESVVTLPGNVVDKFAKLESRILMHVRVKKLDGTHMSLFNTHLTNNKSDWDDQVRTIKNYILSARLPESEELIFGGDMNASTETMYGSDLSQVFWAGAGRAMSVPAKPTYTFPAHKYTPTGVEDQDIDHIFDYVVDPDCVVFNVGEEAYTLRFGSDHAAVLKQIKTANCDTPERRVAWMGPR